MKFDEAVDLAKDQTRPYFVGRRKIKRFVQRKIERQILLLRICGPIAIIAVALAIELYQGRLDHLL